MRSLIIERIVTDIRSKKIPSEKTLIILFSALAVGVVVFFVALSVFYPMANNYTDYQAQLYRFKMIFYMIALLVFIFSLVSIFLIKGKTEIKFTVIFALTGLIYCFIITPYSGPDEMHHWYKNYIVSNVMMHRTNVLQIDEVDFRIQGAVGHENVPSAYITTVNSLFRAKTEDEHSHSGDMYSFFSPLGTFDFPIARIPSALGLSIARLLSLNSTTQNFMGRLANLAFTVLMIHLALKIIPKFKIVVFVIAMLPMFLQLASSLSYDPFVNGLSLLLLALIFKQVYSDDKMKIKDYLIIFVVSILLSTTKVVYFPLTFFIFCIPVERFNCKKDFWIKTLILVSVSILASVGYYVMLQGINTVINRFQSVESRNYNFAYVISNPIGTIKLFINTITRWFTNWVATLVGVLLSGLSLPINRLLIIGFLFILLLLCIKKKDGDEIAEPKVKIAAAVSCFAVLILVLFTMMTSWTPRGENIIHGIQGRYFFPIALPLIILIRSDLLTINKDTDKFILCSTSLLSTLVIFDVLNKTIGVL